MEWIPRTDIEDETYKEFLDEQSQENLSTINGEEVFSPWLSAFLSEGTEPTDDPIELGDDEEDIRNWQNEGLDHVEFTHASNRTYKGNKFLRTSAIFNKVIYTNAVGEIKTWDVEGNRPAQVPTYERYMRGVLMVGGEGIYGGLLTDIDTICRAAGVSDSPFDYMEAGDFNGLFGTGSMSGVTDWQRALLEIGYSTEIGQYKNPWIGITTHLQKIVTQLATIARDISNGVPFGRNTWAQWLWGSDDRVALARETLTSLGDLAKPEYNDEEIWFKKVRVHPFFDVGAFNFIQRAIKAVDDKVKGDYRELLGTAWVSYIRLKTIVPIYMTVAEYPLQMSKLRRDIADHLAAYELDLRPVSQEEGRTPESLPNLKQDSDSPISFLPHQLKSDRHLQKRPDYAVLDIAPGGGKCVVGSTLVETSKGLKTLEEIWNEGTPLSRNKTEAWNDIRIGVHTLKGRKFADRAYRRRGRTTKVRMSNGWTWEGLGAHRFYVLNPTTGKLEFMHVKDMKNCRAPIWVPRTGEKFNRFPEQSPLLEELRGLEVDHELPKRMTTELAEILGWIVSEGSVAYASIEQHDRKVLKKLAQMFASVFGVKIPVGSTSVGYHRARKAIEALLGEGNVYSNQKFVPKCIRTADRECQQRFLQALFQGDGTIYSDEGKANSQRYRMEYGTVSDTLAQHVVHMLDSFGIKAKASSTKSYVARQGTKDHRNIWRIVISGSNIQRFYEEVGFLEGEKQDRLEEFARRYVTVYDSADHQGTNADAIGEQNTIPGQLLYQLNDALDNVIEQAYPSKMIQRGNQTYSYRGHENPWSLAEKESGTQMRTSATWRKRSDNVTRLTVGKWLYIFDHLDSDMKQTAIKDDTFKECYELLMEGRDAYSGWVTIESVKQGSHQTVYDLHVPGEHNYAATGIYQHNTIIAITDALRLMKDGAQKTMVVCPGTLVAQWTEEIQKFCGGKVNAFPLTQTETYKHYFKNDPAALTAAIIDAPVNTIFILDSTVLSVNSNFNVFPYEGRLIERNEVVEALRQIPWDVIYVDESHRAKSPSATYYKQYNRLLDAAKKIRLMSGTFVHNTARDVLGQSRLVYPGIFGSEDDFNENYIAENSGGTDRFKQEGERAAMRHMSGYLDLVQIRREEWAQTLPDLSWNFHGAISLTPKQRGVYDLLVELLIDDDAIIDALNNAEDVADLKKVGGGRATPDEGPSGEQNDDEQGIRRVGNLSHIWRIEQFLSAPNKDPFADMTPARMSKMRKDAQAVLRKAKRKGIQGDIEDAEARIDWVENVIRISIAAKKLFAKFEADDKVSPKSLYLADHDEETGEISGLIAQHFGIGVYKGQEASLKDQVEAALSDDVGKVMIYTSYLNSAEAIYEHLIQFPEYKNSVMHYTAARKKSLVDEMKVNKKVKIVVGVEKSLNTGFNFQMFSRLIRVETVWTPGELEQGEARIYRPDVPAYLAGEVRAVANIDILGCDRTLDITKGMRLIAKQISNAKANNMRVLKLDDVPPLPQMKVNAANLQEGHSFFHGPGKDYADAQSQLSGILDDISQLNRDRIDDAFPEKLYAIDVEDDLEGSALAEVPHISGNFIPFKEELGLMSFSEKALQKGKVSEELDMEDLEESEYRVHTMWGDGLLDKIDAKTCKVRMADGTLQPGIPKYSIHFIAPDAPATPVREQQAELAGLPYKQVTGKEIEGTASVFDADFEWNMELLEEMAEEGDPQGTTRGCRGHGIAGRGRSERQADAGLARLVPRQPGRSRRIRVPRTSRGRERRTRTPD